MDVGCGQGRDALFIARMGHSVVGVDLSPNGIRDMIATAKQENLPIEGIVADLTAFAPSGDFEVVLIDRTLHMLPEAPRLNVLERLIAIVRKGGWVLIADERSNLDGFRGVFDASSLAWETEMDKKGYLFKRRL